jgi:hypothetical protein
VTDDRRTLGQWNAYVESGATHDERRARLEEVPEDLRATVKRHAQTVFALRKYHSRKGRGRQR